MALVPPRWLGLLELIAVQGPLSSRGSRRNRNIGDPASDAIAPICRPLILTCGRTPTVKAAISR